MAPSGKPASASHTRNFVESLSTSDRPAHFGSMIPSGRAETTDREVVIGHARSEVVDADIGEGTCLPVAQPLARQSSRHSLGLSGNRIHQIEDQTVGTTCRRFRKLALGVGGNEK